MGINAAFSSWLRGAQSTVSSGIRAAQNFGAAFQAQTMTALNTAQRAVTQPFQPQQTQQRSATPNPYTARTITPATIVGEAGRAISSGVRGAQQAAQQIVRAHAPIVQGVQRDASRAIRAAPAAIQSAPRSVQQAAQQIVRAHAPIVQGLQRDTSRAIRAAPAAIQSAPRSVQQAAQQISRAHTPIVQGVRRDASRAIRAAPAAIQSAPRSVQQAAQQISRAHAPIVQGVRRDASRAIRAAPAAIQSAPRSVQQAAQQISRTHAPIVQGVRRDAGRAMQAIPQAVANAPAAIQSGARQLVQAHAQIVRGTPPAASAAVRSVGGAGPARVDPRVASTSPTLQDQIIGAAIRGVTANPVGAPIAAAYGGFVAGQDILRYNTAIDQLKGKETAFQQEYTKWKPVYDQYVKDVEEYQTSPLHQQTNSPQAQQALRQKYDALKQYETRLAPLFQSADAFEQHQQTLETLQAKGYDPITAGIIDALGAARTGATPPASRKLAPISTEQAWSYGAYPALAGAAEWYTTKVKDPFRQGATAIVEEVAPAPIRDLALRGTKFATGLVGAPADLAVQAGMAIPGAEMAGRALWDRPVETPSYLVAGGLAYMGAGLVEGLQKEPEETLGSLAGTVLLTKGAGKAAGKGYILSPIKAAESVLPTGKSYRTPTPERGLFDPSANLRVGETYVREVLHDVLYRIHETKPREVEVPALQPPLQKGARTAQRVEELGGLRNIPQAVARLTPDERTQFGKALEKRTGLSLEALSSSRKVSAALDKPLASSSDLFKKIISGEGSRLENRLIDSLEKGGRLQVSVPTTGKVAGVIKQMEGAGFEEVTSYFNQATGQHVVSGKYMRIVPETVTYRGLYYESPRTVISKAIGRDLPFAGMRPLAGVSTLPKRSPSYFPDAGGRSPVKGTPPKSTPDSPSITGKKVKLSTGVPDHLTEYVMKEGFLPDSKSLPVSVPLMEEVFAGPEGAPGAASVFEGQISAMRQISGSTPAEIIKNPYTIIETVKTVPKGAGKEILDAIKEVDPAGHMIGGSFAQRLQSYLSPRPKDLDIYTDRHQILAQRLGKIYEEHYGKKRVTVQLGESTSRVRVDGSAIVDIHSLEYAGKAGRDIRRYGIQTETPITVEGIRVMALEEQALRKISASAAMHQTPQGWMPAPAEYWRGKDLGDTIGLIKSEILTTYTNPIDILVAPRRRRTLAEAGEKIEAAISDEYPLTSKNRDIKGAAKERIESYSFGSTPENYIPVPGTRRYVRVPEVFPSRSTLLQLVSIPSPVKVRTTAVPMGPGSPQTIIGPRTLLGGRLQDIPPATYTGVYAESPVLSLGKAIGRNLEWEGVHHIGGVTSEPRSVSLSIGDQTLNIKTGVMPKTMQVSRGLPEHLVKSVEREKFLPDAGDSWLTVPLVKTLLQRHGTPEASKIYQTKLDLLSDIHGKTSPQIVADPYAVIQTVQVIPRHQKEAFLDLIKAVDKEHLIGGTFAQQVQSYLSRRAQDIDLYTHKTHLMTKSLEEFFIEAYGSQNVKVIRHRTGSKIQVRLPGETEFVDAVDIHPVGYGGKGKSIGRYAIPFEKPLTVKGIRLMPLEEQYLRKVSALGALHETPEGWTTTSMDFWNRAGYAGKDIGDVRGILKSLELGTRSDLVAEKNPRSRKARAKFSAAEETIAQIPGETYLQDLPGLSEAVTRRYEGFAFRTSDAPLWRMPLTRSYYDLSPITRVAAKGVQKITDLSPVKIRSADIPMATGGSVIAPSRGVLGGRLRIASPLTYTGLYVESPLTSIGKTFGRNLEWEGVQHIAGVTTERKTAPFKVGSKEIQVEISGAPEKRVLSTGVPEHLISPMIGSSDFVVRSGLTWLTEPLVNAVVRDRGVPGAREVYEGVKTAMREAQTATPEVFRDPAKILERVETVPKGATDEIMAVIKKYSAIIGGTTSQMILQRRTLSKAHDLDLYVDDVRVIPSMTKDLIAVYQKYLGKENVKKHPRYGVVVKMSKSAEWEPPFDIHHAATGEAEWGFYRGEKPFVVGGVRVMPLSEQLANKSSPLGHLRFTPEGGAYIGLKKEKVHRSKDYADTLSSLQSLEEESLRTIPGRISPFADARRERLVTAREGISRALSPDYPMFKEVAGLGGNMAQEVAGRSGMYADLGIPTQFIRVPGTRRTVDIRPLSVPGTAQNLGPLPPIKGSNWLLVNPPRIPSSPARSDPTQGPAPIIILPEVTMPKVAHGAVGENPPTTGARGRGINPVTEMGLARQEVLPKDSGAQMPGNRPDPKILKPLGVADQRSVMPRVVEREYPKLSKKETDPRGMYPVSGVSPNSLRYRMTGDRGSPAEYPRIGVRPYPEGYLLSDVQRYPPGYPVTEGPYPPGYPVTEGPYPPGYPVTEGPYPPGYPVTEGPYPPGYPVTEGPYPPSYPVTPKPPRPTESTHKRPEKPKGGSKRRRKRPGELDHWEYGPAPGLAEMHGLIFGSPDRSPLDLGPPGLSVLNLGAAPAPGGPVPSFGFAARAPARPPVIPSFGPPAKAPGKKPAHAGKTPAKKKNHGILNDGHRPTIPKTKPRTTNARTPDRRRDPAAGRNPARDARPGHRPAQKTAPKRDHPKGR